MTTTSGSNSGGGTSVQKSLVEFLQSHVSDIRVEDIDEIVLNYVTSILEDLGRDNTFDIDDFCEMLFAYLPRTAEIDPEAITAWMFQLSSEQRKQKTDTTYNFDLRSVIEETTKVRRTHKNSESPSSVCREDEDNCKKRIQRLSENSDGGSENSLEGEEFQMTVEHLTEMFPYACQLEVVHCLTLMAGDVEAAAHLIMHRHETGQSLQPSDRKMLKINNKVEVDEKELKQRIVGKYGFVDQAEDTRYHRPTIKKHEEKKLIRYRDGKIVSTKGERFTQVTKQESEEMKKSYVNINRDF